MSVARGVAVRALAAALPAQEPVLDVRTAGGPGPWRPFRGGERTSGSYDAVFRRRRMPLTTWIVPFVLAAGLAAQDPDVAGFAKVSADEPLSFALRAPGRFLAEAVADVRSLLPQSMHVHIDEALEESADEVGFGATEPEDWVAHGLDPDGDFVFALAEPGGWLGLPQRFRARLAVVDVERAIALVLRESGPAEPLPGGGMVGAQIGCAPLGSDLVVVTHSGIDDPDDMPDQLRAALAANAAGETVGGQAVHRAVASRVVGGAVAAMFLRPDRWRAADDAVGEPSVWDSVLVGLDRSGLVAALRLRPDPERDALLARGGDPRPALAAMPRPAAVLALSLADPAALLGSIAADDQNVAEIRAEAVDVVDQLGPLLRGGSFGVVAYPGDAGAEPRWAVFAATTDHGAAVAAVSEALTALEVPVEVLAAPEDTRLWRVPNEEVVLGVRDGVVYAGDAADQVLATVRGESAGHEPDLPGDALGAFELSMAALLGPPLGSAPPELLEGGVAGRLDLDGDVLVASLRRTGVRGQHSVVAEAIAWAAVAAHADTSLPVETAKVDAMQIHTVARIFATKNGRIPTIEDLIQPDETGNPYIEGGEPPLDPWGAPYRIRLLEGRLRFEVLSPGPDGRLDTDDDVVYPARRD